RAGGRGRRVRSRRKPCAPQPGFVPRLEAMEDRTLLSVRLLFDATGGTVALRGDAGDHTIREALNPRGFLEVTLDGQRHSSDPASTFFDRALAGATASTVAGVSFDGGSGHDTLILGDQKLVGGFRVNASGATVVTEGVIAAGSIEFAVGVFVNGGQVR